MTRRAAPVAATALALAAATGCTVTRSYDVSVRNGLDGPVTICLTKAGGPAEAGWESPEELASPPHPASDERPPGVVLQPGHSAHERVDGAFYREARTRAILRVYRGTPTLTQMNAIARGQLDRLDVPLREGVDQLVVQVGPTGRMEAVPDAAGHP